MKKTVIVGGGIAGLAAAHYLQELGASDFTLVERSSRWGGKITSIKQDGFLVEGGPDSFLTQKQITLDLCRKLGLEGDLVGSSTGAAATTYVWSRGRLHPMPAGMMLMAPTMVMPFLKSRLISWSGKLRMGLELFIPKKSSGEDESLASFVRRRFGREALNKIAGPLMAGIHAADPEKLSIRSTFPIFPEMEKQYGSLLRGMKKRPTPQPASATPRPPMFTSLRHGLTQLPDALIARLPPESLRLGRCVLAVHPEHDRYRVLLSDGSSILADDIVFATPSHITADLVQQFDPLLATLLSGIRYVSTATVSLGFRRSDIRHPMRGSGFIVPHTEGCSITACSWASEKLRHRAPDDCALLRIFIGGSLAEDLAEMDEDSLVTLALNELRAIMGISATPLLTKVYRWHKGVPQYDLGYEVRIGEIERRLQMLSGLHIAGAAYRGAGIPDCIQSGQKAANAIVTRRARSANHQDKLPLVSS